MTISNETVRAVYSANGVLDTFAIPFSSFSDETDYYIVKTVDPTDYTTETTIDEGVAADEYQIVGANIVFNTPPANGLEVLVARGGPLTQETDLGTFYPNDRVVLERRLDRIYLRMQELQEQINRSVQWYQSYSGAIPPNKIEPGDDEQVLGWMSGELANLDTVDAAALAQIAQNTADIATNASDISDNASDILSNAADIAALQTIGESGRCVLNNNQAASIDMTDANFPGIGTSLTFDNAESYSVRLEYEIRRKDGSEVRLFNGALFAQFDGTNWVVTENPKAGVGNPHGVTWGITMLSGTVGVLNYITNNMTGGAYEGHFTFVRTTYDLTW